MRSLLLTFLIPLSLLAQAASMHIQVKAPTYAGEQVQLYRCMDLVTFRLEPLSSTTLDATGNGTLDADVEGTWKGNLRIGGVTAELLLRAGRYHIEISAPEPNSPRSADGGVRVDPLFLGLDPLDINALVTDLNVRLDAFIAQDLATDQDAGMEAIGQARRGEVAMRPDTSKGHRDLFLSPRWSPARVDTFERKLRRFYEEVDDPWFKEDLDYGIASLYLGPRITDRELFDRFIKDKPVLYDVPEYMRFTGSLFEDQLMRLTVGNDREQVLRFIHRSQTDSLKALLARNDLLKDDRSNELVLMTSLYQQQGNEQLDRAGILGILKDIEARSRYPEHRNIAANMVWDLTAMHAGTRLPSIILPDAAGTPVLLDSLIQGPTCIVVTSGRSVHGEREMVALEALYKTYSSYVRFIGIGLDGSPDALRAVLEAHPDRQWTWLYAGKNTRFLDEFRITTIPTLYFIEDGLLANPPSILPSKGLAPLLYRIKVKVDEEERFKPDLQRMPPKR